MPLIDYLILVPLQQEWDAARDLLAGNRDRLHEIPDGSLTYATWTQPVTTTKYSGEYLVAATPMSLWTPGQALAAVVAKTALAKWHPNRVILIGIAGSIEPERVCLGDVVIAAEVRGYEISDAGDGPDTLRPTFNQPGAMDLNRVSTFKSDAKAYAAWGQACLADAASHGLGDVVTKPPKLHVEVIASGNRVVKSREFGQRLKDQVSKHIVAVEMEARGVHQALYHDGSGTDALTVRGISDYADIEKEKLEKASKDGWRTWAASNAARLVRALLQRGTVPPISSQYQLDLTKGPHKRFAERDVPRFSFRHIGSQSIAFTSLLKRTVPTPAIALRVTAITDAGDSATGFAGVCMIETPAKGAILGKQHAGGGLAFDLPHSEWGLNAELLVSFPAPVREITVRCEDDFGRSDSKTIDFMPVLQRETP